MSKAKDRYDEFYGKSCNDWNIRTVDRRFESKLSDDGSLYTFALVFAGLLTAENEKLVPFTYEYCPRILKKKRRHDDTEDDDLDRADKLVGEIGKSTSGAKRKQEATERTQGRATEALTAARSSLEKALDKATKDKEKVRGLSIVSVVIVP